MSDPAGELELAAGRLIQVQLGGFQSYGAVQSIALHPLMTLLVGKNDVGKSALFRALRSLTRPVAMTSDDFNLS